MKLLKRLGDFLLNTGIGSVVVFLCFFGLWDVLARARFLDLRWWMFLVPPSQSVQTLWELLVSGQLLVHVEYSLFRIAVGFALAGIFGSLVGIWIGWNQTAAQIFEPIIDLIRPFPKPALLPLLIVFFGIGEFSKIALIAFGNFFIVAYNSMYGARNVNRELINSFRVMGASPLTIFRRAVFPASLPHVVAGLRISLTLSFTFVVFAELLAAEKGLGYFVQTAYTTFHFERMFAGIFTMMLLGGTSVYGFMAIERRALKWYHATRGE